MADIIDPTHSEFSQTSPENKETDLSMEKSSMGSFATPSFTGTSTPDPTPSEEVDIPLPGDDEEETIPIPTEEEIEAEADAVDETAINLKEETTSTDPESDAILNNIFNEGTTEDTPSPTRKDVFICIPLSTLKNVTEELSNEITKIGEEAYKQQQYDNSTKVGAFFDSTSHFQSSTALNLSMLKYIKEANKTLESLNGFLIDKIPSILDGVTKGAKDPQEKIFGGKKARNRIISQIQGVRRVALWNSGFFITIRPLNLGEIAQFINICLKDAYYYGREMGGFFYLYGDMQIKELVVKELLPRIIIDSNLKEHNRLGPDIIKYISIHDYDTLLWAMASLMHRDGVPIRYCCAEINPNTKDICGHIDEMTVDISKLRLFNPDLITKDMITFMNSKEKVTNLAVDKYRKNILKDYAPFKFKFSNKATGVTTYWQMTFRVPTIEEYLVYGGDYSNSLFEVIGADARSAEADDINNYIRFNFYKLLLPWIDSISELRDLESEEKDNIIFTWYNDPSSIEDRNNIKDVLDMFNSENIGLDKAVHEYVKATKITHIAYQYTKCPVCGKAPATSFEGFIPFDVQAHFFTMCLIRSIASQYE